MPDYAAYVYIRPNADIYVVTLPKQVQSKFPEITSAYKKACDSYHSVHHRNSAEHNYRKPFERLNAIFEMIVHWFCKNASIPFENKSIVESAMSLKKAGFNSEQMNVVYGVLYAMDEYKDSSRAVSEIDIKRHFVSIGCILKIFKAAATGKKIETVPCAFSSKRQQAEELEAKQSAKPLGNKSAQCSDKQEIDAIKREFEKAKKLNNKNDPQAAIAALKDAVVLSLRRICRVKDVKINNPFFPQKTEPPRRYIITGTSYITINSQTASAPTLDMQFKFVDQLHLFGAIDEACASNAKDVLRYAEWCESKYGSFKMETEHMQNLIQHVGSTVIHVACTVQEKNPNQAKHTKNKASVKRPSFKAMEKNSENTALDLKTEYPELVGFIETAQKRSADGEYEDALHSLRNALEFMVNTLCQKYTIKVNPNTNLLEKIDLIAAAAVISDAQRDILHRARKLGNIGAHHGIDEATENKVQQGMDLIQQTTTIFTNLTLLENTNENTPMIDPDFYSSSRKYYGLWNKATRFEQLMLNMNYVKLNRRADAGDIEAMLDIAIGFLANPDNMKWGLDGLILSPDFEKMGYRRFPDRFDARYYFWILKAGEKAYADWVASKVIPLKYIATALAEGLRFMYDHMLFAHFAGLHNQSQTQYGLAQYLFSNTPISYSRETVSKFAIMLICMLEEYNDDMKGKGNIIAPIHCMSILSIKCYTYMYNYFQNPAQIIALDSRLLIKPSDAGKTYYRVVQEDKKTFEKFLKVSQVIKDSFKSKQ
ncbi:MAG: DUF4145 domain-containing protein [Firmicutes bacterium]|nr:DUF4145 domain-containing protein [Bacillota bacterium]